MSEWMITASGSEYELNGPQVLMDGNAPRIDDIAHSLALINRFNGHTCRPYSVAEHSLLVTGIAASRGASAALQMACLMHDAHECYVGDMASPVKWALGIPWISFEAPHIANVHRHFGLKTIHAAYRAEIKHCDLIALATERRDLTLFDAERDRPWPILDTPGREIAPWDGTDLDSAQLHDVDWTEWRDLFLQKFKELRP